MKAQIALEYIGEAQDALIALYSSIIDQVEPGLGRAVIGPRRHRKPWVAEVTGRDDQYGLARQFMPAKFQRKRANSAHSRGVELWFVLESGHLYEVNAPVSWRARDRYFCTVSADGEVARLDDEEVQQWLNARSA